jgi:hypothetical protein
MRRDEGKEEGGIGEDRRGNGGKEDTKEKRE